MPIIRPLLATALVASAVAVPARSAAADSCPQVTVPGAEHQVIACLDDLTTAGTVASGHTVPADYAGLHPAGARNPSGVPGMQIDGYFPDDSTFNTHHGWNHDSQFVIRLPERWNGGLVVAGTPGNRRQYANDFTISDRALAKGYAYAAIDKGNSGLEFYKDGDRPGDAIAEWNFRLTQLTKAARQVVKARYGRTPSRTYAAGVSNGGYLVRWQLEKHPELYTGGIDWEGTLWSDRGPNLLKFLPTVLSGSPEKVYPAASSFLWPYHRQVYWDLTQRIYREEIDPAYDGDLQAGIPYCAPGTPSCDADYDYDSRPHEVRKAVRKISLTGEIGRPMITIHGTLDALLPIDADSDHYAAMIRRQGRSALHRYYRIEDGNHTDGLYDAFPDRLRPLLPCYHNAFDALEAWTTRGVRPPASATLPRPDGDVVTTCPLTGGR
ncbi:tannase/feruloyl esterase family alpha/beta hydrolase [Thermomonospora cellulosilytica]|uniref:Putative esterase n=1 Tax=Thermomonospora cellulosilytica TaxID=1411118 RepID=A0A7W3MVL5_9ACTN|nr:tannase/feruloyl esterase family alpha/beta hydrolase [Thermomonospora cellulosilytica]MBA9002662.1 putative esterase [Thermomonospora cellulosilytica]